VRSNGPLAQVNVVKSWLRRVCLNLVMSVCGLRHFLVVMLLLRLVGKLRASRSEAYKTWRLTSSGIGDLSVYHALRKHLSESVKVLNFTDRYLGQASITSRDVPIEKIGANTEFKLSFTSLRSNTSPSTLTLPSPIFWRSYSLAMVSGNIHTTHLIPPFQNHYFCEVWLVMNPI
jgi:hypothetical protein